MSRPRKKKSTAPNPKDQRIAELEEQLARALAIIERLRKQVEDLQKKVDELERAGRRQATPFARRELVEEPKRPGRKAGQGRFSHRRPPSPRQVHETREVKLHGCPECGGKLQRLKRHEQYVTDIPPVQPIRVRYITYSGYCGICHRRVRSRHGEQNSQATGAAGELVGPRAKALASDLKHRLGVSYAKVSEVLEDAFGLQVSRSGWCQADQRLAQRAKPVYEELVEVVRQSSVVHADETGWRIDTLSAWLWVFASQQATVYSIREDRSSDVVVEILGQAFQGTLVSDCYVAYDDRRLKAWLKQKCVAHLLRDWNEMQESQRGRALQFARQLIALLKEALALKKDKPGLDPGTFSHRAQALEARLDALIAPQRRLTDRQNARMAKRLRKHRPHLLRFLYLQELEATNNLAERMLRPAVITRKTNGCNRTRTGAQTHAILASVLTTCHQHHIPILDYMVRLQRFGETSPPLLPIPSPSNSSR